MRSGHPTHILSVGYVCVKKTSRRDLDTPGYTGVSLSAQLLHQSSSCRLVMRTPSNTLNIGAPIIESPAQITLNTEWIHSLTCETVYHPLLCGSMVLSRASSKTQIRGRHRSSISISLTGGSPLLLKLEKNFSQQPTQLELRKAETTIDHGVTRTVVVNPPGTRYHQGLVNLLAFQTTSTRPSDDGISRSRFKVGYFGCTVVTPSRPSVHDHSSPCAKE